MADTTYILTLATNFDNAEQVKAQAEAATGFTWYIDPSTGQLHTTATAETLQKAQDTIGKRYTVYNQEGSYNPETGAQTTSGSGGSDQQGAPTDTSTGPGPTGAADNVPGLMAGGTIYQVSRQGLPDTFVYAFEFPKGSGKFVSFGFDSLDQIEQAVGKDWYKTIGYKTVQDSWLKNSTDLGSIDQITGLTGDFYSYMNAAAQEAAAQAGINDPTLVSQMLNDPEMQNILAEASFGNLTDAQIMAKKRQTHFWKDVLYPGIENLYGSTANPEQAWNTYARSVEDSLVALGYQRGADGTFKTQIGDMLSKGIDQSTFNNMAPVFVRAEQNQAYFNVLDQWSQHMNGKAITFGDWFDVLNGETPAELNNVVEAAGLQYVNDMQNAGLTQEQITKVADLGQLSEADAAQAFTQYQDILHSLAGEGGITGKYGLTKDEILSLSTGISADSGRSSEEIKNRAVQAAKELGALDDQKLQFFVGYDQTKGNPNRPGLNLLAPEGA